MKGFDEYLKKHWKKYFIGTAILGLVYIFSYIIITEHLIGKPVIDYEVAFEKIECCMTYDELVPIIGKGNEAMWYFENEHSLDRFYQIRRIRNIINGIPYGYSFSNGGYRILTEGTKTPETKITKATLHFRVWGSADPYKRLEGCVC